MTKIQYCKDCGMDLTNHQRTNKTIQCRDCFNEYMRKKQKEFKREQLYWGGDFAPPLYGGYACKTKPGHYHDDEQKEYVENILKAIGWTKSEEGVWYKNGIKNKDQEWECFNEVGPTIHGTAIQSKFKRIFRDNPELLPLLPKHKVYGPLVIRHIQEAYFLKGYPNEKLISEFDITQKDVKWIKESTYRKYRQNEKKNKR